MATSSPKTTRLQNYTYHKLCHIKRGSRAKNVFWYQSKISMNILTQLMTKSNEPGA